MKLETERLILREVKEKDARVIVENIKDIRVSRFLALVPHPYVLKDAKSWINSHKNDFRKKNRTSYTLMIKLKDSSELVGCISLDNVDKFNGTATLGYWLGKKYWKNKIMTEAVISILDFAFNKLKLRRINVGVYTENKASNALIRKIGFKFEGIARKGRRTKSTGRIHNENKYGLLKEEWVKKRKGLIKKQIK